MYRADRARYTVINEREHMEATRTIFEGVVEVWADMEMSAFDQNEDEAEDLAGTFGVDNPSPELDLIYEEILNDRKSNAEAWLYREASATFPWALVHVRIRPFGENSANGVSWPASWTEEQGVLALEAVNDLVRTAENLD